MLVIFTLVIGLAAVGWLWPYQQADIANREAALEFTKVFMAKEEARLLLIGAAKGSVAE